LRIVGGSHKGRKFRAPSSIPARPTTDFAKEALFNILQHEISWPESNMLDLFAGIGSISLEAASRGAMNVVSIDLNNASIRWINQVCKELDLKCISTVKSDALKWLNFNETKFDLVFADPPYDFDNYDKLIDLVLTRTLASDGIFILEHRRTTSFAHYDFFLSERKYGEVKFSTFKLKQNEQ
jgi:16S rRNA (guanine966-N2)-methyltransferase